MSLSKTRSPGTTASSAYLSSDSPWTTTDNAKTSNDAYAVCNLASFSFDQYSYILLLSNFSFDIPSNSSIDGIVAQIEKKKTGDTSEWFVVDDLIRLWDGSAFIGNNKADSSDWSTSDEIVNYGDTTDLWGLTPTASDINDNEFGIAIVANFIDLDPSILDIQANIDHAELTIYYTPGGLPSPILPQYRRKRQRLYI